MADPNFDSLLVMVQINPFFDELIEQYRWIHYTQRCGHLKKSIELGLEVRAQRCTQVSLP
jgi:hypothetical protein